MTSDLTADPDDPDEASVASRFDDPDEGSLEAELAATDATFGATLAELLAAPADLPGRTTREVQDSLLQRSTLATLVDLAGLGWHTTRYLLTARPTEERP